MPAEANGAGRRLRIITKKELREMVPYTPQHILRLENSERFPRRVKIGENRVGWVLDEIEEWLRKRMADRPPSEPDKKRPPPAE